MVDEVVVGEEVEVGRGEVSRTWRMWIAAAVVG